MRAAAPRRDPDKRFEHHMAVPPDSWMYASRFKAPTRERPVFTITSGEWQQPLWPLGCPRHIAANHRQHFPGTFKGFSRPVGASGVMRERALPPGRQPPGRLRATSREVSRELQKGNELALGDAGDVGRPLVRMRPQSAPTLTMARASHSRPSSAGALPLTSKPVRSPPRRNKSHGTLFLLYETGSFGSRKGALTPPPSPLTVMTTVPNSPSSPSSSSSSLRSPPHSAPPHRPRPKYYWPTDP